MRKGFLLGCKPSKYKIYQRLINSYRWQQLRHKKFVSNPVCEECLKVGRVRPTEEVHHVIPVEDGRDEAEMKRLAYDFGNLRSLCRECHAAAHRRPEEEMRGAQAFASVFGAKWGEIRK